MSAHRGQSVGPPVPYFVENFQQCYHMIVLLEQQLGQLPQGLPVFLCAQTSVRWKFYKNVHFMSNHHPPSSTITDLVQHPRTIKSALSRDRSFEGIAGLVNINCLEVQDPHV